MALNNSVSADADAERRVLARRRDAAAAHVAVLLSAGAAPEQLPPPKDDAGDHSEGIDSEDADLMRESERLLQEGLEVVARMRDELQRVQRGFYDSLAEATEQMHREFAARFRRGLVRARMSFLGWRVRYSFLSAVPVVPYVVTVGLALLLMKAPQLGTRSPWIAACVLLALSAVMKRYVSTRITKMVDSRIDAMAATGLEKMTKSFVLLEADLAAHRALRAFVATLSARSGVPLD